MLKPTRIGLLILGSVAMMAGNASAQETAPIELEVHATIKNPAKLDATEANQVYSEIKKRMADGYGLSEDLSAVEYQEWKKFSTAPYLSAGHGNRYVSNYGNKFAEAYSDLDDGVSMPHRTVLAKDSFTVMDDGKVFAGALFLMEKLSVGAHPDTGDWRYVMILPEGSLLGDTTGENPDAMTFCHDCHQQVEDMDYLFGIPADYMAE